MYYVITTNSFDIDPFKMYFFKCITFSASKPDRVRLSLLKKKYYMENSFKSFVNI
jgi:hypothetical protein